MRAVQRYDVDIELQKGSKWANHGNMCEMNTTIRNNNQNNNNNNNNNDNNDKNNNKNNNNDKNNTNINNNNDIGIRLQKS